MRPLSLCEMAKRMYDMKGVRFPFALAKEEAPAVLAKVDEYIQAGRTKVLCGVYNGRFREGATAVLKGLLEDPRIDLTVLLLGTPYDMPALLKGEHQANVETVITTYEYTMLSARALMTALSKGEYPGSCPFGRLE